MLTWRTGVVFTQLQGLQPGGFWPRTGIDLAASGSNGHMSMIQMMQAERAVSERDAQRQRTGGSMKQTASIPHNAMMMSGGLGHAMSHGFNGMMTGKGGIPRGDPRMGSGHITFGVDAYNAFRGMFDHSGPIGINVGAGLSGSGLIGQGYSAPMRSAPLGLPSLGADFVSRFHQQTQQPGGGESVESRYREMEPPVAAPPKAQYDDLENVADILTFGGRCVPSAQCVLRVNLRDRLVGNLCGGCCVKHCGALARACMHACMHATLCMQGCIACMQACMHACTCKGSDTTRFRRPLLDLLLVLCSFHHSLHSLHSARLHLPNNGVCVLCRLC